jgi:hypothetical protein
MPLHPQIEMVKQVSERMHISRSDAMILLEARGLPLHRVTGSEQQSVHERVVASTPPWRFGIEPMGIEMFSVALDGVPLSDYQVSTLHAARLHTARAIMSPNRVIQEGWFKWGKGAGKDWLAARLIAWFGYVLLHIDDVQSWLRPDVAVASDERIDVLNVAPKGDHAKAVFFEYLARNIRRPLFAPFVEHEKQQILKGEIHFPQINLHLISLNSSASGADGYNPLMWVMDEADAFVDGENRSNAQDLYRILRSSSATRWRTRWLGMILSYMRSGDGFMSRSIEALRKDEINVPLHKRYWFIDEAASWSVNPNIRRDDPVIEADYRNDPVTAAAMYEGIAPPVVGGFFDTHELIDASQGVQPPLVMGRISDDGEYTWREMQGQSIPYMRYIVEGVVKEPGRRYYLGTDAGESGDAFAVSVWSCPDLEGSAPRVLCPSCIQRFEYDVSNHRPATPEEAPQLECVMCGMKPYQIMPSYYGAQNATHGWKVANIPEEEGYTETFINGRKVSLPRLREDFVLRVAPRKRSQEYPLGVLVDFPAMEQALVDIITGLGVSFVRLDPWQTVQMGQSLADRTRADVGKASFTMPEQFLRAFLCKVLLNNGCLRFLPHEDRDREWKQLIRKRQRIDHPQYGSKDIYDAESVAIWLAICDRLGTFDLTFLTEERTGSQVANGQYFEG